jgi:predicted NBD/HSP70 family sugar kinase
MGSGLGASIITGSPGRSGSSTAVEWGHTTIEVGGRLCRCGARGCLEAYVGAEAILDRYGLMAPGDDEESAFATLLSASSARAAEVLDETALYLGAGIANLINLFGPERIILGGWAGLLLGDRILPGIRAAAQRHALSHRFAQASIEIGQLGPDAVALGAATLPMEHFLNGALPVSAPAAGNRAVG